MGIFTFFLLYSFYSFYEIGYASTTNISEPLTAITSIINSTAILSPTTPPDIPLQSSIADGIVAGQSFLPCWTTVNYNQITVGLGIGDKAVFSGATIPTTKNPVRVNNIVFYVDPGALPFSSTPPTVYSFNVAVSNSTISTNPYGTGYQVVYGLSTSVTEQKVALILVDSLTLVLAVYNAKTNSALFSTVFTFASPKLGTNPKSFVVGNVVSSLIANPSGRYVATTCGGAKYLRFGNNWQVQLPYSSNNRLGITTIANPSFQSFASPYFYVNTTRKAIQFYTANTGITTPGTSSPRTELRQMVPSSGGTVPIAWSSTGRRKLTVKLQVDYIPPTKFVIFTQIVSGAYGAYFTFRVASTRSTETDFQVLACAAGYPCLVVDPNYSLGTVISLSVNVYKHSVTGSYANIASNTTNGPFVFALPAYNDLSFKLGSYCGITVADSAAEYCQVSVFSVSVA
ncbi:UNVERIFIED_CONTAM: hypothetical protein HDU68_002963 [Siphonaria sp. JEL0065]|nr:hypothetical protein HDU68_002963 [Siphonaria sp. JEL0065]